MASRFMGFARLFSSAAKNSTRKEGFGRMFSSTARKSTKNHKDDDYFGHRMKEIFGDLDYDKLTYAESTKIITRHANREVDIEALKILSMGVAMSLTVPTLVSYFSVGWYPFKNSLQSQDSRQSHSAEFVFDSGFPSEPGFTSDPFS